VKYSTDLISNEYKSGTRVTQPKSWLITTLVLAFSLLMAASTFAQQGQGQPEDDASVVPSAQAAANLMLAATTVRTETGFLSLGFNPATAFCPYDLRLPVNSQGGLHSPSRRFRRYLERQPVQCCPDPYEDKRAWRSRGS